MRRWIDIWNDKAAVEKLVRDELQHAYDPQTELDFAMLCWEEPNIKLPSRSPEQTAIFEATRRGNFKPAGALLERQIAAGKGVSTALVKLAAAYCRREMKRRPRGRPRGTKTEPVINLVKTAVLE
jgi:hypothetical protein